MRTATLCVAVLALILLGSCRGVDARPGGPTEFERLVTYMTGSFSSAAQAAEDDEYFDIRVKARRVWEERGDGVWLYIEQAVASKQDAPYRVRMYRIDSLGEGVYSSSVFTLPGDAALYVGAWKDPTKLDAIASDELERLAGCDVFMTAQPDGSFTGGTDGTGCASTFRGADYVTTEVRFDVDGFTALDRGYSRDGEQVWGPADGGYRFDRIADLP